MTPAPLTEVLLDTMRDVAPILLLLVGFQVGVLRQPVLHLWRVVRGFLYVLIGLTLFLMGLERAIFPLGEMMAEQLTAQAEQSGAAGWGRMAPVYLFAFCIGLATTLAEPALMAVAMRAERASGGAISSFGLRLAVAFGVGIGVTVGCFRIVSGTELWVYMLVAYIAVMLLTLRTPPSIIPLAYDLGGVTTSTVTVPLLAALGIGLANAIPGRSPLIDGFGLVAFASIFPIVTVLLYAILGQRLR